MIQYKNDPVDEDNKRRKKEVLLLVIKDVSESIKRSITKLIKKITSI